MPETRTTGTGPAIASIDESVERFAAPHVWGAGQILAFSALDGETCPAEPMVLHTGEIPGSLQLRLPVELAIEAHQMPPASELRFGLILGDAIEADSPHGPYRLAFADRHTVVADLPREARLVVAGLEGDSEPKPIARHGELVVWMATQGQRWALMLTADGQGEAAQQHAQALWQAAQQADVARLIAQRSAFVMDAPVPSDLDPASVQLLRKAITVMKVNYESPCGRITRRWTTPDRWPHRHMWLWDSAFHAIGMMRIDPDAAADAIGAVLDHVDPETGFLSHTIRADAEGSPITQPPILAWAACELIERHGPRDWARPWLAPLKRYLDWSRRHRDANANGVPEWRVDEADPLCRCGESGLDNSPRFDRHTQLDAVDFGSWLAHDYACLTRIAELLGEHSVAEEARRHAQHIGQATNTLLWCEQRRFYFDRDFEGNLVPVKTIAGLMPLFAGIASPAQAAALRDHVTDPATFGAAMPVPTVALNEGAFCKDLWRGPAWVNTSYMVYRGLKRYGFEREADQLRRALLEGVMRWYQREGCLFEFYDALDLTSPRHLDRKRRLALGDGIAPITDYHWTAAVVTALLVP